MFEHLKWKLVERPLLPIGNSYVDAFPFLILFALLFISGCALKSENRKRIRPYVQISSFIFFIFVVHRCFCALRGWLFGLQEIGRNDLAVFNGLFIFVPLIAFTVLYGRVFCAWMCPLGAMQETFFRFSVFGYRLSLRTPNTENRLPLISKARGLKLLFLAGVFSLVVFLLFKLKPKTYFFTENIAAFWGIAVILIAFIFLLNPNLNSQLKKIRYLSLFFVLTIVAAGIFVTEPWCALFGNEIDYSSLLAFLAIVSTSAFVSMAWCRYLCPLGSFLSIVTKFSCTKIKRNNTHSLSSKACRDICYVEALGSNSLDQSSCLYCGRCVDVAVSKIEEL
jgi:ferredoxin-type protein NapH